MRFAIRRARASPLSGYSAAAVVVLIVASYPVATRAGVTGSFALQDLVLLRFGVGALLFLPYLALQFRTIRREAWLRGVPLTLFQGVGMAALVICGLQFAPANHAAALGPGVVPAWVALFGFLLFARRPSTRMIVGAALCAAGVATLAVSSAAADPAMLAGDAMFLAASALGALYLLQVRNWGIGALQGAAIVTLYSALVVVPWYLWSASGALWQIVAPHEFFAQVVWQGVLIGCIALVALNHAIARLGPERASALVALVPALSAVLALLFLGEIPSNAEIAAILAISIGVSIGVSIGASRGYGGSPAASSAAVIRPA